MDGSSNPLSMNAYEGTEAAINPLSMNACERARTCIAVSECVCEYSRKCREFAVDLGLPGIFEVIFTRDICMNPNGRKQQSTEHERLRSDGSSIQLMCTSTGRHEGFWKRMGVLISPRGKSSYLFKIPRPASFEAIHGSSDAYQQQRMKAHLETHGDAYAKSTKVHL